MIPFKNVTLCDKSWVDELVRAANSPSAAANTAQAPASRQARTVMSEAFSFFSSMRTTARMSWTHSPGTLRPFFFRHRTSA